MLSHYLVGDLTGRLSVMGQVHYGVARSITEAVFAGLGLFVIAFAIVWVVSRKWPHERPAVSQNQPLQGEALTDEDTGMNTPTPMDDATRLMQEMKESARRDAARALEGFEKRAERIEEGRPARSQFKRPQSAQPKATAEAETENPRSLQEVLDQAKQREEHRYREAGRARVEDDDDQGVMVVHRDDIPKIEAMTRLINEGFDREFQHTIEAESEQREIEESLKRARERRVREEERRQKLREENAAQGIHIAYSHTPERPDLPWVVPDEEDIKASGVRSEGQAYDMARKAVRALVEQLRAEAVEDSPRIAAKVNWLVFGAMILGAGGLSAPLGIWAWVLFGLICWGAQVWICRLAKRGKGAVPHELEEQLTWLWVDSAAYAATKDFERFEKLAGLEPKLHRKLWRAIR